MKEVICGIYKITSPSGRIYIGQSVDIYHRFKTYKRMYVKNEKLVKLYRSFLKYGVDNHIFEIIEECEVEKLNIKERHWQEFYNCISEKGLNCFLTKIGDRSGKASEETLKRMSEAQKGNQNWLGKKHTQETKDKMSKAKIGTKFSDEVNKKKGRKGNIPPMAGKKSKEHVNSKPIVQLSLEGDFITG